MSETAKKRIVIASVLKPVDDTRMFGKIGLSLANTRQYEVHVIGFPSSSSNSSVVKFHPLPRFSRLSLQRLMAAWKILIKLVSLKPSLLIVTTHELLIVAGIAKLFTRCKVIYDVQENYCRNILHLGAFPQVIRPLIAFYVRTKEIVTAPFVNHFFLAEKGYGKELSFPGSRKTILENKALKLLEFNQPAKKNDREITLIFSGTLAETTGVFKAIELAAQLHQLDPRISLTIVGYCSKPETFIKLKQAIGQYPFIRIIGGDYLVPHEKIQEQIVQSDFGMVLYDINPSTENSIPTKLYEYLGASLPILLTDHIPWVELCKRYDAAIVIPQHSSNITAIHDFMLHKRFYTSIPEDVYWESEENKLTLAVKSLL